MARIHAMSRSTRGCEISNWSCVWTSSRWKKFVRNHSLNALWNLPAICSPFHPASGFQFTLSYIYIYISMSTFTCFKYIDLYLHVIIHVLCTRVCLRFVDNACMHAYKTILGNFLLAARRCDGLSCSLGFQTSSRQGFSVSLMPLSLPGHWNVPTVWRINRSDQVNQIILPLVNQLFLQYFRVLKLGAKQPTFAAVLWPCRSPWKASLSHWFRWVPLRSGAHFST